MARLSTRHCTKRSWAIGAMFIILASELQSAFFRYSALNSYEKYLGTATHAVWGGTRAKQQLQNPGPFKLDGNVRHLGRIRALVSHAENIGRRLSDTVCNVAEAATQELVLDCHNMSSRFAKFAIATASRFGVVHSAAAACAQRSRQVAMKAGTMWVDFRNIPSLLPIDCANMLAEMKIRCRCAAVRDAVCGVALACTQVGRHVVVEGVNIAKGAADHVMPAVGRIPSMLSALLANVSATCSLDDRCASARDVVVFAAASSAQIGRQAAIEAGNATKDVAAILVLAVKSLLVVLPVLVANTSAHLRSGCRRAGGLEVVVDAAAAGGTLGLCAGALLLTGDARPRIWRLGIRRRLLFTAALSAGSVAYFATQPISAEGGEGIQAQASAFARKLGRSTKVAITTWRQPLPIQKVKHGHKLKQILGQ